MSKRNITFTKPEEPNFLKRIKEQVGYKEGPTVNTKREALDRATEEDFEDTAEEQPTVVVLRPGDLSAEEAAQATQEFNKQAEETPADLNIPVVFKQPSKAKTAQKSSKRSSSGEDQKTKKHKGKTLLSFDDEEHDD